MYRKIARARSENQNGGGGGEGEFSGEHTKSSEVLPFSHFYRNDRDFCAIILFAFLGLREINNNGEKT